MRLPLGASLLVLVGLTFPVHAQPAESASHEMIKDVLRQLDCEWQVDDWKYAVELKNRKITLLRLDNGKRLLVKAAIKDQPSLDIINRYNEQTAVTTRAVRYEKFGAVLESGIDCQLGISAAGMKKWLTRFVVDVADFEAFIAKNRGKDDKEPRVFTKGEKQKPPLEIAPGSDDREFVMTFPSGEKNWETAWKVVWDIETSKQVEDQGYKPFTEPARRKFGSSSRPLLFKIKKAYFKPGQGADWIQVLEDAHPQEFYVPYFFQGTRFYDLRDVGGYVTLNAREGGAVSQLMGKSKQVIAELRDTGPAYKHGNITRRGEELTLFANFQASNYTYMIEYGFRDDGGIVFRHSPTGYNFFSHLDASHMHGSYWRIGMKLGPDGNNDTNQVHVVGLPLNPKDQGGGGKLNLREITRESFVDWNPKEFTRIRVSNPNYSIVPEAKDRPALPISYDLVTYPQGIARHARFDDEKFTLHDFWITRHDCPEKMYVYLSDYFAPKGQSNPNLLNLEKQNVVLWHSSSGLHTPRAEDGILTGNSRNNGQATIYWTTFELRPRNLFLRTPLYRTGEDAPPKIDAKKKIVPKIVPGQ
jgi:hypothetical protein